MADEWGELSEQNNTGRAKMQCKKILEFSTDAVEGL